MQRFAMVVCAGLLGMRGAALLPADPPPVRQAWVRTHDSGNTHDRSGEVTVSPDGEIFLAGTTSIGGNDVLLAMRFEKGGNVRWTRGHATSQVDRIYAIATDSAGNAVIVASTRRDNGSLAVIKLEPLAGDVLWERLIPQPGNCLLLDAGRAGLAIDGFDSIHVVGCHLLTVKLDADGNEIWRASHEPGDPGRLPGDVVLDSVGNVYVAGVLLDVPGDFGVVAYDAAGNLRWSDTRTGPIGSVFSHPWLDVDPADNLLVAAEPESQCGVFSLLLWKYDSPGNLQWIESFPDEPCTSFMLTGMSATLDGDVIVGGFGLSLFTVIRYAGDGSRTWEQSFGGHNGSAQAAYGFAADPRGYSYLTGMEFVSGPSNYDIVTAAFGPDGRLRWSGSWGGSGNAGDRGTSIAVDPCGRVYTVGSAWAGSPRLEDIALLRYTQGDLRVVSPDCADGPAGPVGAATVPRRMDPVRP